MILSQQIFGNGRVRSWVSSALGVVSMYISVMLEDGDTRMPSESKWPILGIETAGNYAVGLICVDCLHESLVVMLGALGCPCDGTAG